VHANRRSSGEVRTLPPARTAAVLAILAILAAGCSEKPHEKVDSIYALKNDLTPENVEAIRGYLDDRDRNVRATALYALASAPVEDAVELCLAALEDPDFFLRATAADLLGELGDPGTVDVLVKSLLEDGDWHVRFRASGSLATIGGAEAVAALVRGLEDPIKEVRLACVEGVGRHDPAVGIEAFSRMVVKDNEWEVRVEAARALGRSGLPSARPAVEAALEDPNEFVRSAAAHALRLLEERAGKKN
jgi:HEAT repeat protein